MLLAVRELARRERKTAGQILTELARRGLRGDTPVAASDDEEFFGFRPLAARDVVVTKALVDQLLADDLE